MNRGKFTVCTNIRTVGGKIARTCSDKCVCFVNDSIRSFHDPKTGCYIWNSKTCMLRSHTRQQNARQCYLTLKCTADESSHFFHYFLASNLIFHHHDRGLTKFHAGSEQPLVCVVINNSHYPVVKNNTAYHAFGKYWMQARGLLNFRLKYCWLKVICCTCQSNELNVKLSTQLWGPSWGQSKIWGWAWPTQAPP